MLEVVTLTYSIIWRDKRHLYPLYRFQVKIIGKRLDVQGHTERKVLLKRPVRPRVGVFYTQLAVIVTRCYVRLADE